MNLRTKSPGTILAIATGLVALSIIGCSSAPPPLHVKGTLTVDDSTAFENGMTGTANTDPMDDYSGNATITTDSGKVVAVVPLVQQPSSPVSMGMEMVFTFTFDATVPGGYSRYDVTATGISGNTWFNYPASGSTATVNANASVG